MAPIRSTKRCIHCGRSPPVARPSREHVLPDVLGGTVTLPSGAVCIDCNNLLNTEIDQPLKELLAPFIARFNIVAKKRPRAPRGQVTVTFRDGTQVPAVVTPGGIAFAPRRRIDTAEGLDGQRIENWLFRSQEEMDARLQELRAKCPTAVLGKSHTPVVERISYEMASSWGLLIRATARGAINYLAWRHYHLGDESHLFREEFDWSRYLVRDASALTDSIDATAWFDPNVPVPIGDIRPLHLVVVGADKGGPLRASLILFGYFGVSLIMSPEWLGDPFHAEEEFNALTGETTRVDRAFIHPSNFRIVL